MSDTVIYYRDIRVPDEYTANWGGAQAIHWRKGVDAVLNLAQASLPA